MPMCGRPGRIGVSLCLDCDWVPVFVCELVPDCPDSLLCDPVPVCEPAALLFDPVAFDPACLLFDAVPLFDPAFLLCEPVPLFDPPFLLCEPVPVFVFDPVRLRLRESQSETPCPTGGSAVTTWPPPLTAASAAT